MSHYTVHTINAFTGSSNPSLLSTLNLKGNPAGVCMLSEFPEDSVMQAIAKKMELSETAFLVKRDANRYDLRWFTPTKEVPLCGHATLAAAHYLRTHAQKYNLDPTAPLHFETRSGILDVSLKGEEISLTVPRADLREINTPELFADCIDVPIVNSIRSDASIVIEVADMDTLKRCRPNLDAIAKLDSEDLIVTCAGEKGYDYSYRCFCPQLGIDEDPVTGSANCTLAPYWSEKFGKTHFRAYQASELGGELGVTVNGNKITISGKATSQSQCIIGGNSLLPNAQRSVA